MKKFLAIALTLVMALSLMTVAFGETTEACSGSCEHKAAIGTTHYDTLEAAVGAAKDGDTIELFEGEHILTDPQRDGVTKVVSFQGAGMDKTILRGHLKISGTTTHEYTGDKTITVSDLTLKPQEAEMNDIGSRNWGLFFGDGYNASASVSLDGFTINVTKCRFSDWQFAINLMGNVAQTKSNTLKVTDCLFDNVFCATNINGNVGTLDLASNIVPSEKYFYSQQLWGTAEHPNDYFSNVGDTTPAMSNPQSDENGVRVMEGFANYDVVLLDGEGKVTRYGTLTDVVNAAEDNNTIVLLTDVTGNVTVPAGKKITLDATGHKLTGTLTAAVDDLTLAGGTFTAANAKDFVAPGYKVNADGTVVKKTSSGGRPYTPPEGDTVNSAKTFDAGVALYAGMTLTSALGAAYVTGKRR